MEESNSIGKLQLQYRAEVSSLTGCKNAAISDYKFKIKNWHQPLKIYYTEILYSLVIPFFS